MPGCCAVLRAARGAQIAGLDQGDTATKQRSTCPLTQRTHTGDGG